ncbi:DNA primase [Stakelama saccharophila]|uniref:DNA primase n=1 Tax=Stakelama saccharophila TaxID=3075605 RepID=A0ABZ0B9V3_9SPHN|nr:DNA primase [Stakelama sp. W311]WNO54187.1 DNA primase [Stakelama sp. W311]
MGGHQVPEQGPKDDGYDERGYDESQRAEILETTRDGRHRGGITTDLNPDLGDPEEDEESEDMLEMTDSDYGEEAYDARHDPQDRDEDEVQADYDDDQVDRETLSPQDRDSLEP